jgi:hypothetical protein
LIVTTASVMRMFAMVIHRGGADGPGMSTQGRPAIPYRAA